MALIGVRTTQRSCSRMVWLQKSTSGVWPALKGAGLASSALEFIDVRARGERAPEAGSRRQSRENGDRLLVIPCASGVEGALVDGRRPGVWTASPLTRGWWKRTWLPGTARLRSRGGGARHRVSEATSRARHAVENTAAGRRRSEGPSIAAPARNERCPFSRLPSGLGRRGAAWKVGTTPKLEVRRQAKLHSRYRRWLRPPAGVR
jgi:hypothetical protein